MIPITRHACFALALCMSLSGCGSRSSDASAPVSMDDSQASLPVVNSQPPADAGSRSSSTPAVDASESTVVSSTSIPESEGNPERQSVQPQNRPTEESIRVFNADREAEAASALESQLAELKIPPAWLPAVESFWDRSRPWQEARLEIRRLLGVNTETSRREALRLMWDYRQKNDMGDGHEYSMYTYLGQEPVWAIRACREWLARKDHPYAPNFCLKSLASLYMDRGMYREAERVLLKGLNWPPEEETWRRAEFLDSLGDLYVAWGRIEEARNSYRDSIELYPRTNPPYGQHLIPRRVKTIQSKLDILSLGSLNDVALRDGNWNATVPGYSEDLHVTAQVRRGRLEEIQLKHNEKIDQGATIAIPQRIIERQTLNVDGITGATITKDAIVTGTLQALRQAGLP